MARPTPLHDRTQPLCSSWLWREWNGYAAVRAFDAHSEGEYFAIRHAVGLMDASPLSKHEIRGADAGVLLSRVFSRDAEAMRVGRVQYGVLTDAAGRVLDDGTVARLDANHYRLATNERWSAWLQRHGRGLQIDIEDSTERLAVLAVQGPLAHAVLSAALTSIQTRTGALAALPPFWVRPARIGDTDVAVSRTGYTGDLGYEIWVTAGAAPTVWDALMGADHGVRITPFGLDALDVARIEAGFLLAGVDYFGARTAANASRTSTPDELGLGGLVALSRTTRFIGQAAIERERARGSAWRLVGLSVSGEELERLYDSYALSSGFGPHASRVAVPVYAADGETQVGQATSHTWSPVRKGYLALASVRAEHAALGTALRIEHTPNFERRAVAATVVERPFFAPPRRKETPP